MSTFPNAHFSSDFRRVIVPPYQGKKLIILVKLTPVIETIWGIAPVRKSFWYTAQVLWRSMSVFVLSVGHRAAAQAQCAAQGRTSRALPRPLVWLLNAQSSQMPNPTQWQVYQSVHWSGSLFCSLLEEGSEAVFESFPSPFAQRAQSAIQPRT